VRNILNIGTKEDKNNSTNSSEKTILIIFYVIEWALIFLGVYVL
jgi:hypothetical protein